LPGERVELAVIIKVTFTAFSPDKNTGLAGLKVTFSPDGVVLLRVTFSPLGCRVLLIPSVTPCV